MSNKKGILEKYVCVNISLPPDIYEWVSEKNNMSGYISDSLRIQRDLESKEIICKCGATFSPRAWEKLGKECPDCREFKKTLISTEQGLKVLEGGVEQ